MGRKINGQETNCHVRCFRVADWLKNDLLCSRNVETQLQIVVSVIAIDGVSIVHFPVLILPGIFILPLHVFT